MLFRDKPGIVARGFGVSLAARPTISVPAGHKMSKRRKEEHESEYSPKENVAKRQDE